MGGREKKGGGAQQREKEEKEAQALEAEERAHSEAVGEAMDGLSEKRTASRVAAAATLSKLLRERVAYDALQGRLAEMGETLARMAKRGDAAEASASCEALRLVALSVGADAGPVVAAAAAELLGAAAHHSAASARAEAFRTLALLYLVAQSDFHERLELVRLAKEAVQKAAQHPLMASAAFATLAVLATEAPQTWVQSFAREDLPQCVHWLSSEDVAAQTACADFLALLFSLVADAALAEEGLTTADFDGSLYDLYEHCVDGETLDTILERLSLDDDGATRTRADGQRLSKKDMATLRASFGVAFRALDEGYVPPVSLSVNFQALEFDSWAEVVQLRAVIDALQAGTLVHFENNDLLEAMFDYRVDPDAGPVRLSKLEKRLYQSKSSDVKKQMTLDRHSGRKTKHAMKNHNED